MTIVFLKAKILCGKKLALGENGILTKAGVVQQSQFFYNLNPEFRPCREVLSQELEESDKSPKG
jgi:hypothetical protein